MMPTVKPWSATCVTAHDTSDANAPKVMGEGGVRQCIWPQTDSDMQNVDWESLLADPADGSATIVHFMAA
eukprot:5134132-Pyramimonas_sp.AAC.1